MAEQETKSVIVTQAVHDYAVAHGTPPDAVQESLITATAALGGVSRMQIAPEQGAFMTMLDQRWSTPGSRWRWAPSRATRRSASLGVWPRAAASSAAT